MCWWFNASGYGVGGAQARRAVTGSIPVKLERTAFRTSRLLDFASAKELTAQTGHPPEDWPLVVVKELIDNALDACEEAGLAPEIAVRVRALCSLSAAAIRAA
jgi:hypothetical protein